MTVTWPAARGTDPQAWDGFGIPCCSQRAPLLQEPLFAPAKGATREDDGYLLEVVYDGFAHRSELQIYRADAVTDRVATLKLPHHLPHQFHGHFTRAVPGTPPAD